MIIRVTVANIKARDLATWLQDRGLSGTVFESLGAGSWGIEEGATFEVAGEAKERVYTAVVVLLQERHEEAAYVTVGATAYLWYADGRVDILSRP